MPGGSVCCGERCQCLNKCKSSVVLKNAGRFPDAWEPSDALPIVVWRRYRCRWASEAATTGEQRIGVELPRDGKVATVGSSLNSPTGRSM